MTNPTLRLRRPGVARARVRAWLGDAVAALMIVGAAFAPFRGAEYTPSGALGLAVVVAPALLLPLRRRWPIPVLAGCVALFGAAAILGTLSPGAVLGTAIAMFGVANRSSRRLTMAVAAAAVAAVVLLSLLAAIGSVFDPRTLQFAILVAFAAAAGDATRSRREYIEAITERAERAEQTREAEARRRVSEERLKIARDLHDTVAHQISVISLNAGVASSALESRPEKAKDALATIRGAARTVLGEIGDLLEMLRADDGREGAGRAPQPGLDRLNQLVGEFAEAGLRVQVRAEGDVSALPRAVDHVAYRVIQESLTNAHKHGAEHRAHVFLDVDEDRARIVITNPVDGAHGMGSEPDGDVRGSGHGLLGIRERVASVRGTVAAGMTPGGYRVAATLPLVKERIR